MPRDPDPDFEDLRDHLTATPREESLHGLLQHPSVAVLWGRQGQGKTLLFLSAAASLLWGADFNGKPARQGMTFYFTWEGDRSLTGLRRVALYRYYRRTQPDVDAFKAIHFHETEDQRLRRINLFSETGRKQLAAMIRETSKTVGMPVALVGFDTGGSMIARHHKKETGDIFTTLALFLRALADEFKCVALVLLHARAKGDDIRGPVTFLTGEADTEMRCESTGERNERVYVEVRKQRAGRGGQIYQFDVVETDIAPGETQPVLVFRGEAGAPGIAPLSPRAAAETMRDSEALLRMARAVEDGERLSVSALARKTFGDDGGNQLKRIRRLIPATGIVVHVPEHHHMVRLALVVEDEEALVICEIKPETLPAAKPPPYGIPAVSEPAPTHDTQPADHQDGDDEAVPAGHMSPRETRWFHWFQRAWNASDIDVSRYANFIGNPRFPVFTADREAGIGALHLMVANAHSDAVRERARQALEKFGVVVPPPESDVATITGGGSDTASGAVSDTVSDTASGAGSSAGSDTGSGAESDTGSGAVKQKRGWPKGKKRGPRRTVAPPVAP